MSQSSIEQPLPVRLPTTHYRAATHLRLRSVEQFISGCPDRYFITLTMKRRVDEMTFTAEVSKALHRVNSRLFGTSYTRRNEVRLATMATQERTLNDGLHTHLLVGVPEGALALKANPCLVPVPDLIVQEWISADPQYRRASGQDARDVYDFSGARSYISKEIKRLNDFENFDVLNTIIP